jgi:hypothetical protein
MHYLNKFHAAKCQTKIRAISSSQNFLCFFIQEVKQRKFHLRVCYAASAATRDNVIFSMVALQLTILKADVVLSKYVIIVLSSGMAYGK